MRIALAAVAVGLVAGMGGTVDAAPGAEPQHITQLAWSPNGKWLAYLIDDAASGQASSLHVVRLDRRVQRRVVFVTPREATLYGIAWSPDSKQVAVRLYDMAGNQLSWIAAANGLRARHFVGRFEDWAPDGRRFVLFRSAERSLYVVDSLSGGVRFLAQGALARWSPNGRRIAFSPRRSGSSPARVFSVDANGTDLRQEGADSAAYADQIVAGWSHDSTKIAYYESYPFGDFSRAFIVPADGSRRATQVGDRAWEVLWSPGGRRLAVRDWSTAGVKIMTLDGSTLATLSDVESDIAWAPGGRNVVFTGSRPFGPGIYIARADGRGVSRHVSPGTFPAWSKPAWIALAYRGTCAGGGDRVFVVRPNGKHFHALSRCRPTS
jgi:Tol biopolymer transport system component